MTSRGLTFKVYIVPRSSRSTIVGNHQGALKIKLTAPPAGGAANKQCVRILAKALGLPKSVLTIVAGHTSRFKQICIQTATLQIDASDIQRRIEKLSRPDTNNA